MNFDQQVRDLENYKLENIIGSGSFASVYKGVDMRSNEPVAIKVINKANMLASRLSESIAREIKLTQNIEHPYIIRGIEVIDRPEYIYIVMEYASNGSLLTYINQKKFLSEDEAKDKVVQLLLAVQYLHDNGIAHRDIKPENILLDDNFNVKLIDFGLANTYSSDIPLMSTTCGSIAYSAPELLKGELYTAAVDIWSCGIILYAMILGYLPFRSASSIKLAKQIVESSPKFPKSLSPVLIDLLHGMLNKDPQLRLTADEALQAPWINEFYHQKYFEASIFPKLYFSKNPHKHRLTDNSDDGINGLELSNLATCPLVKMKTDTFAAMKNMNLKRTTTSTQQSLGRSTFNALLTTSPQIRCRTKTLNMRDVRQQSDANLLFAMVGRSELPKL